MFQEIPHDPRIDFLLHADFKDAQLEKAVSKYLDSDMATVTPKNTRKVIALLKSLLLKNDILQKLGEEAAVEVALQLKTSKQQRRFTKMIVSIDGTLGTDTHLQGRILKHMPPIDHSTRMDLHPSRSRVIGGITRFTKRVFTTLRGR